MFGSILAARFRSFLGPGVRTQASNPHHNVIFRDFSERLIVIAVRAKCCTFNFDASELATLCSVMDSNVDANAATVQV